jgi:hypothetical protein
MEFDEVSFPEEGNEIHLQEYLQFIKIETTNNVKYI